MRFSKLLAIILVFVSSLAVVASAADYRRIVGLSVGAGVSSAMGDLADANRYDCKLGAPRLTLAIEVYPVRRFSIGGYLGVDNFGSRTVVPGFGLLGHEQSEIAKVDLSNLRVFDFGVTGRFFFRTGSAMQPFLRMWFGVSCLLATASGETYSSHTANGWGCGPGLMYLLNRHFGFTGELMYNNTRTGETVRENTSRINLGVWMNLLIG